jgi:uncharacterized iron-regulated membrane protein
MGTTTLDQPRPTVSSGWLRGLWSQPRKTKLRQSLFQIHLWTGLVLGLVIGLVGLTGAIVVYRVEMNRLSTHAYVIPAPQRLSLDELVSRIQDNRPHDRVRNVAFEGGPDAAWNFRTETPEGHRVHTFIDQYRGVITGSEDYNTQWLQWIFDLHAYLLNGKQGEFLNGFVALFTLAMSLSGLVVWWPGIRKWRFGFKYLWGGGWQRQNYDLHKIVGFCGSALLAVVSFSGAYFAFPGLYKKGASSISKNTVTDPDGCATDGPSAKSSLANRRVTLESYIESAERAAPGMHAAFLSLPMENGKPVGVKLKEPNDWHRVGLTTVYLEPATGDVIRADIFSQLPVGGKLLRLMLPLHFGRFGGKLGMGTIGKHIVLFVYFLVGLAVPLLMTTGYLMYWNRDLSKKFKRARVRSGLRAAESSAS